MNVKRLYVLFQLLILALLLLCRPAPSEEAEVGWHVRVPTTFFSVAFGNERFIAVGEEGSILTSSDGLTWSSASSGTRETLRNRVKK